MWKYKGLQLVMLPTEEKLNIGSLCMSKTGLLHILKSCSMEAMCSIYEPKPQHLYLLSDEEIKEGDIYLDDCNDIRKAVTSVKEYWSNRSSYKKIISSIDPSLNLPQFPNAFIEEYVNRYNSKKSLEVEVEYEEYDHDEEWSEISGAYETFKERVKVNEPNTISIRFKEEKMYTEEEVDALKYEIVDLKQYIYSKEIDSRNERERDVEFLKEIKDNLSKYFNRQDVTKGDYAMQMIEDWIRELNKKKEE